MKNRPDNHATFPMKKILALNGSPRRNGNTSHMLYHFLTGAQRKTHEIEEVFVHELNLEFCRGCLRCNVLGRCSIHGDAWENLSSKILESDILVFATPVYFHHVTAQLKRVIDRFRSFIHVAITETGLEHTPRHTWRKDFVLLMSMGSSSDTDAQPAVELFEFMTSILGDRNHLHVVAATRLAVNNQVAKSREELLKLYPKLNLSAEMAESDYLRNQQILQKCNDLGRDLT